MNCGRQVLLVSICLFLPILQFMWFKSETWATGWDLFNTRAAVTWVNYFLALVFLAHTTIDWLGGMMNIPMLPVLDPPTADLILGIVGALAAMLDLAEMIREGHGWGTACTFAELGYTFRTIARENPECFPVNS